MNKKIEHLPLLSLMREYQQRVERTLDHWLPPQSTLPNDLHEAMRYAAMNGGKRVRAVLAYATGRALGSEPDTLDGPAAAVELIHAYSLIHDDLPAMDNAELRRGKPTLHRAFNEAVALLAGDALQSQAFYILAHDPAMCASAEQRLDMVSTLALAIGSRGMAGGQALDLASEGQALDLAELENMHIHKTGALIRASVRLGALASGTADEELAATLDHFAKCIGLAFQVRDDIIDVESDTETLGKTQGSDAARAKATYPALLGMSGAKEMANELYHDAINSLAQMDGDADPLRWLAAYIVQRTH